LRIEFKSKAVVHLGQHKAPIASDSLADNGLAINAFTVIDVVRADPDKMPITGEYARRRGVPARR